MDNKDHRIIKFRRSREINIGIIILVFLFIYVIFVVVAFFNGKNIVRYEVLNGNLVTTNRYTGLIVRKEKPVSVAANGYINYCVSESERVAVGDLVYILDQNGSLSQYLADHHDEYSSYNQKEVLDEIQESTSIFSYTFDPNDFSKCVDFRRQLEQTARKFENTNLLNAVNGFQSSQSRGELAYAYSSDSGIVVFSIDGMEELDIEMLTPDLFDKNIYKNNYIYTNTHHNAGDYIYKLITSEKWSVVFPIDKSYGEYLQEEEYVKVKFLKNQEESWGKVTLHSLDSGDYLELGFENSMISFAADRYIDIELIIGDEYGLKIPNTSIVEKEFFLIPEIFVHYNENEDKYYITSEYEYEDEATSEHHKSIISKEISVYSFDEKTRVYYVDSGVINRNDILYSADSLLTHKVEQTDTLLGVYNVNKGYADFKEIKVIFNNDEYSIVMPDSVYGLRAHDYIALDSEKVSDNELIVH